MVIVFSFPEINFQRTMTICARRLLEGILVMVIVFFFPKFSKNSFSVSAAGSVTWEFPNRTVLK